MTQTTHVSTLDQSIHTTNEWLKLLSEELGVDREMAYKVLRGYLQTVRDCLDIGEASDLGAQLPMVIRGVYYTGWAPGQMPQRLDRDQFVKEVARRGAFEGDPSVEPEQAARAVTNMLRQRITAGEINDVLTQLKQDVRETIESV